MSPARADRPDPEEYVEQVLSIVEQVPRGRVTSYGSLPPSHEDGARPHYLEEGTPLRASGAVDMVRAFWDPLSDGCGKISSGCGQNPLLGG